MVYMLDPTMQTVLAEQGWDGALRPGNGDFLMVVDANVGYNKASAKVEQQADYEVDLGPSPPQARLTLTYTHTSTADVTCRPESRYAATYEGMMDRCYWDYLRVLAPEGSELVDASRIPVPGELVWDGEDYSGEVAVGMVDGAPFTSWGVMGVVAPGDSRTRRFSWALPPDVVEWEGRTGRYTLKIQKQPGKESHPLTVRLRLPEGSKLEGATPSPSSVGGGWVRYQVVLDQDMAFEVDFRRRR